MDTSAIVRVLKFAADMAGRRRMPPIPHLAQTYGVHRRTVHRYLNALEEARYPMPPRAKPGRPSFYAED